MTGFQSIVSGIIHHKWAKIGLVVAMSWFAYQLAAGHMNFSPTAKVLTGYARVTETGYARATETGYARATETGKKEGDMGDKDQLNEEEGRYLLQVARKTIEKALFTQEGEPEDEPTSGKYNENRGTFVTLTKDGNLRGCIGHIIPRESLIEGIRVNAINAAFRDPRFPGLDKGEWPKIRIEISILTEPRPLSYAGADDLLQKLRHGVDGVILKKGYREATFLPQVWEQLPDKKEFLSHLCLKAGLDANAWQKEKLEISIYQVQAFEEH